MVRRVLACLSAVLLVAAVTSTASAAPPEHAHRHVTVATYNIYLGADLNPLFGAGSQAELVQAAATVFAQVQRTDFPSRAEAIADQLAAHEPEVVGLQEVALFETGPGGGELSTSLDYLALLLDALERRGLSYRPVAVNSNFGGTVPISTTQVVRFTDRDVILVRTDVPASTVKVSNPQSHLFETELVIPTQIPGLTFTVPRGWSAVDVKVRGKSFRFVNTHLEAFSAQVRTAQSQELLAALADSPLPVVLVGDLNTCARNDAPCTADDVYESVLQAGYVDAWTDQHGIEGGFTVGQTADLDDPSRLDHRVDYVMFEPDSIDSVTAEVIGDEPADRTDTTPALWPSDHAGVVATLDIGRP